MYQNLVVRGGKGGPVSVHLCDYPLADLSLVDEQLSADVDALLDVVSLGSAARDRARRKRRQPLAELKVQPGSDSARRAVERFPDQIRDELNLKQVSLHPPEASRLLRTRAVLNKKTAAGKFGRHLGEVQKALAGQDPTHLFKRLFLDQLTVTLATASGTVVLEPADVVFEHDGPEEGWVGVFDRGTSAALDTRVTPELALEGMAREVVRHVQETRKKARLEMEDRIELALETGSDGLRAAIEAHRDYIAAETLVARWAASLDGAGHQERVSVDGQPLTIALRKV
jgi:isoleucyl-tRNA synthetase